MIRPALLAITAGMLSAQTSAAQQIDIAATGPVVELDVYETVDIAPDLATISAGVTTEAPTVTAALRQNALEMQKVVNRIKALGIAGKDIQTAGINLNPRYDYDQASQRQVFRGYQAANRVSVILRDVDAAGRVLDALVEAGATDLGGPVFGIDDDTAAKAEARRRAVARADAQARAYAAMLGYGAVRVLAISEGLAGNGPMPIAKGRNLMEALPASAPPVEPGMVSAGINVTVIYELVGKGSTAAG